MTVTVPSLVNLMYVWIIIIPLTQKLFQVSLPTARRRLQQALDRLGLSSVMYTWGSLRSGGATFEHMTGSLFSQIKFRGRWAQERTLEHYIQECLTFLNMNSIPASTQVRLQQLAALAPSLMHVYSKVGDRGEKQGHFFRFL